MPQSPDYTLVSTLVPGDRILAWQQSTDSMKNIDFADLAAAVVSQGPDVSFPYVLVDDHGAVGDGSTDDTIAITSAITSAGPNAVVVFSSGKTYLTTTPITIPNDNVTLLGYGSVITSALETQVGKFVFNARTKGRVTGLRFNCIYSSGGFALSPAVVDIDDSSDITVDNCDFDGVANSAIRITGRCFRTIVANNRFSNCFLGVFSDDDALTYQPVQNIIVNNTFRDGLGSVSEALSGAIKFSGIGDETSNAGHVIANNTIVSPGQVGIEIQTWINDTTISGNTIFGAGYGISVSGCTRVNVSGNSVRQHAVYGLESASGSSRINFSNNVVSSTITGAVGMVIPDNTGDTTVDGCSFSGLNDQIKIQGGARIVITGCNFYRPEGSAVNIIGGSDIAIVGNVMDCTGAYNYIFLDANSSPIARLVISGNIWTGDVTNNGITNYAPNASTISDVTVCNNNTRNAGCPGGQWSSNATVSPATKLLRYRCFGNIGNAVEDVQRNLNMPIKEIAVNTTFFYEYFYYDGGVIKLNASSSNVDFQLPSATGIGGYEITVYRSDASGNAATVSGYSGQTMNGSSPYYLASQYKRARFRSDGSNWLIVESN